MDLPVGQKQPVDVGGRRLDVWRAGDSGPTVLLVHGIPTNSTLWWDVAPVVAQQARVLAVDMLGYGSSDGADGWAVDLAAQASYLLTVLDRLEVERAVVVGHDLGGGVAQKLAVTHGERVAGLGVVDGVCYDGWPVPAVRAAKAVWPLLRVTPPSTLASLLRPALRSLFVHQERAPDFVDRFVAPWSSPEGRAPWVRTCARWTPSTPRPSYRSCPVSACPPRSSGAARTTR